LIVNIFIGVQSVSENLKGRDYLADLMIDGRITVKLT
jgi:hypothetical protein